MNDILKTYIVGTMLFWCIFTGLTVMIAEDTYTLISDADILDTAA